MSVDIEEVSKILQRMRWREQADASSSLLHDLLAGHAALDKARKRLENNGHVGTKVFRDALHSVAAQQRQLREAFNGETSRLRTTLGQLGHDYTPNPPPPVKE